MSRFNGEAKRIPDVNQLKEKGSLLGPRIQNGRGRVFWGPGWAVDGQGSRRGMRQDRADRMASCGTGHTSEDPCVWVCAVRVCACT